MLEAIIKRLRLNRRGVSNVIVVMLSLVLIVIIVGNVVLWSYQMNQLDLERMQETVNIANVTRATRSSWFTAQKEFSIIAGSKLSGTYTDTKFSDGSFETFREERTQIFNPSNYVLGGFTKYVSGSLTDLQSDDSVYMTFRSYVSATSTSNIVTNGNVTTTTDWGYTDISDPSAVVSGDYSSTIYKSASYSLYIQLVDNDATKGYAGNGKQYQAMATVSTLPISANLCFYYRIDCGGISAGAEVANATVVITKPDGSAVTVFTTSVTFAALKTGSWIYNAIDVSSVFTATGTYTLELRGYFSTTAAKKPTLTIYYDDVWLNTVTPSECTSEVEFTGTSNTQNWTQLEWTIDSSFTTTNVATTFQLYDYQTNQYPTSGDGYMNDTISMVDVTKNQTITENPTNFRDANGNWKIKIKGVKATDTQFELKVDWIEFKATASDIYRLCISNDFLIDLSTYPLNYIQGVEISVRYNATQNAEKWFLKAYNWTASSFSDIGFNNTVGNQPVMNEWNGYAINVTDDWRDYVKDDGTLLLEFLDEGLNTTQTIVEIDFLGVRAIIDGTRFDLRNTSPLTIHITAVWIVNSTNHQRYTANLFINSGEETTYIRVDISLPKDDFIAKVVTERGNMAIFTGD